MSEDKPETFSVHVTQQDFGVIRASLIHSYEFWKHVVETGEYPENFDEGKGFEDLYWIGNHIMLDNGCDSILLKKSMNGGIYRKLEENPGDDVPGVVRISTYSPNDFKVNVDYFQLVEVEQ